MAPPSVRASVCIRRSSSGCGRRITIYEECGVWMPGVRGVDTDRKDVMMSTQGRILLYRVNPRPNSHTESCYVAALAGRPTAQIFRRPEGCLLLR